MCQPGRPPTHPACRAGGALSCLEIPSNFRNRGLPPLSFCSGPLKFWSWPCLRITRFGISCTGFVETETFLSEEPLI